MVQTTKMVNTRKYVSVLRELTDQGETVSLRIAGNSMSPFLVHGRDWICFEKPTRPLARGDMVLYERLNGQFVMHRICRVDQGEYYLIGDAQREIEGPIQREQIFGLVTKVQRKGRWIQAGDFWWEFFARVWIRVIPMRRVLCRMYTLFAK